MQDLQSKGLLNGQLATDLNLEASRVGHSYSIPSHQFMSKTLSVGIIISAYINA